MDTQQSRLEQWRRRGKLSQADAAEKIGVSAVAWGRYENGRMPKREIMQKIIELTVGEITANDFFDVADDDVEQVVVAAQ